MGRGRGDIQGLETAPIRGGAGAPSFADRIQTFASTLEAKAERLELNAEQGRQKSAAWKHLKESGVPMGERVMLRMRSRWGKIISKNDEHMARLAEIREEQTRARARYTQQGLSADPLSYAWQAAMVYRPIEPSTESVVEEHEIIKTPALVGGRSAEEPAYDHVQPHSAQAASEVPEPAPAEESVEKTLEMPAPPSQLGGVPLHDIVPHEVDDELGVEIPQLIGDGKEDEAMAGWLEGFESWGEYHSVTRGENEMKRRILANMLFSYHSDPSIARDNMLKADDFIRVAAETGVSQAQAASLFWIMRHDPAKMQRALAALAPEGEPVDQRINKFCEELGDARNAFYRYKGENAEGYLALSGDEKTMTDGAKLALASVLLYAIHGEKTPPYRHQMAQGGYNALGIPKPANLPTARKKTQLEKEGKSIYPTPGDMYVQYLGLMDTVSEKMSKRGRRGADRLAGYEALLWTIDGPKWYKLSQKNQARFPDWDAGKIRSFLAWSQRAQKAK